MMDEMNMNETTVMENENSVEVVPMENVQVVEENEETGFDPKFVIGAALIAGAAVVGGIKHLKSKKNNTEGKPKTKKKITWRKPWEVTEEVVDSETEVDDAKVVEETSNEE